MDWTKPQKDAIEFNEDKNVLVSAAAGSGKTAVLVERIIRKLLDPENPVSVDELLVLTFTNAAAKEMKNKIGRAIDGKLKLDPDNKRLKAQKIKLSSADISTVHAFAQKIITNNIHLTNIPVGYTLGSETENGLLLSEALDECLERYYARIDILPSFKSLTIGHGGVKNDDSLRRLILEIYDFARSLAMPKKWLCDSVNMYREVVRKNSISGTEWEKLYIDAVSDILRSIRECYDEINAVIEAELEPDHKFCEFFEEESRMFEPLYEAETAAEFFEKRNSIGFKTKPRIKKEEKEDAYLSAIFDDIGNLRDRAKNLWSSPILAYESEADVCESIKRLYPELRTLKNIVLMLYRRHTRIKLEHSMLDFSDLEHGLIGLIMNKDGSPTKLCESLSNKYKEIYVDEYQDTNNIQDTMFKLISGGKGNIFMVGDIKQSIYKFRNASPALFIEKYNSYKSGESGHLSILSDNFRSRKTVVDTVNHIFGNIMFKSAAEIDYDDDERLRCGAAYPNSDDESAYLTEVIMTDVMSDKNAPADYKERREAEVIAERIVELVSRERLPVYDSKTDTQRPAEFGDIAVLMRSTSRAAQIYADVFTAYGIPVSTSVGGGFTESIEVGTVLSFLEIIDNPLQDIPLIAVMRSPIFGFTADELAEIRCFDKTVSYYECMKLAAEDNEKAAEFLNTLTELRECSKYMGIHELVYKICYDLDYLAVVAGSRGGALREANLKLLLKISGDYEAAGFRGLFSFMDYIAKAEGGSDFHKAEDTSGSTVQITTIHKSKGLEYPIVILAGTSRGHGGVNVIEYDEELGLGFDYVDIENRLRYPSVSTQIIRQKKEKELRAEEMRLLYVALTRAKEKLIISCTNAGQKKGWKRPIIGRNKRVLNYFVEDTDVFRDWTVLGLLDLKCADPLRALMETDVSELKISDDECRVVFRMNGFEDIKTEADEAERVFTVSEDTSDDGDNTEDADLADELEYLTDEELDEIMGYEYPMPELTQIPLKLSVSEIKSGINAAEAEQEGEYMPQLGSIADRSFKDALPVTAAEAGTITHFVMQRLDLKNTDTDEHINARLSELTARGILTSEQLKSVNLKSVVSFFKSDIGGRIRRADEKGEVLREFKMLFPIKASEVYGENIKGGDSEIIVQGVADCVFFEDGEAVIVDYKTDNISESFAERRAEKYRSQLDLYAYGIEQITGRKVKERIIYFLKPGRAVRMV